MIRCPWSVASVHLVAKFKSSERKPCRFGSIPMKVQQRGCSGRAWRKPPSRYPTELPINSRTQSASHGFRNVPMAPYLASGHNIESSSTKDEVDSPSRKCLQAASRSGHIVAFEAFDLGFEICITSPRLCASKERNFIRALCS